MDAFAVPKKYPNIAKIFTKEWFESEFRKEKEEMHPLARQFTYDKNDRISLHLTEHLEEYLATMQDEINRNWKHFYKGLRNKDQYNRTSAEIEIASLFRKMGFHQVELEPTIPNSKKKGDIKICDRNTEIYIEVSTKKGPEVDYKLDFGRAKVGTFKFQSPQIYRDKLYNESLQLSKFHPGIIALYLYSSSIPERRNIVKAFYDGIAWRGKGEEVVYLEEGESAMKNTIISAILRYFHDYSDGCRIWKELFLNPMAKNPLPDTIISKFREGGIEIKEEPIVLERRSL